MKNDPLQKILNILSVVRGDKGKVKTILSFLENEIVPYIETEEEAIVIPEKYEVLVRDLAQDILIGMNCHLNMDTLEKESYPSDIEMYHYEDEELPFTTDLHLSWDNYISFEPLPSKESFEIMENFAEQASSMKEQDFIFRILNQSKPFANFNRFIHQSHLRESWFKFRNEAYENYVREKIYNYLNE